MITILFVAIIYTILALVTTLVIYGLVNCYIYIFMVVYEIGYIIYNNTGLG